MNLSLVGMLQCEIENSLKTSRPFSLVMFDIDSFKQYNDTWGQPAGDIRMKSIADIIRVSLRKGDMPARKSGPAQQENTSSVSGYTLSVGIATFPKDADTLASLLLVADQAEITANHNGKNQISLASDLRKT